MATLHNAKTWEDSAGSEHHCGVCQTPLRNPKAIRKCVGTHIFPCWRFHYSLQIHTQRCQYCVEADERHELRHRQIADIVKTIQSRTSQETPQRDAQSSVASWSPSPSNVSLDHPQCSTSEASADCVRVEKQRKKDRKADKRIYRAAIRKACVTSENVRWIAQVFHPSDITEGYFDKDAAMTFHSQVEVMWSGYQHMSQVPKPDFTEDVDRILKALVPSSMMEKETKHVAQLKELANADLEQVHFELLGIAERRRAFGRWANGSVLQRVYDHYENREWKTGERIRKTAQTVSTENNADNDANEDIELNKDNDENKKENEDNKDNKGTAQSVDDGTLAGDVYKELVGTGHPLEGNESNPTVGAHKHIARSEEGAAEPLQQFESSDVDQHEGTERRSGPQSDESERSSSPDFMDISPTPYNSWEDVPIHQYLCLDALLAQPLPVGDDDDDDDDDEVDGAEEESGHVDTHVHDMRLKLFRFRKRYLDSEADYIKGMLAGGMLQLDYTQNQMKGAYRMLQTVIDEMEEKPEPYKAMLQKLELEINPDVNYQYIDETIDLLVSLPRRLSLALLARGQLTHPLADEMIVLMKRDVSRLSEIMEHTGIEDESSALFGLFYLLITAKWFTEAGKPFNGAILARFPPEIAHATEPGLERKIQRCQFFRRFCQKPSDDADECIEIDDTMHQSPNQELMKRYPRDLSYKPRAFLPVGRPVYAPVPCACYEQDSESRESWVYVCVPQHSILAGPMPRGHALYLLQQDSIPAQLNGMIASFSIQGENSFIIDQEERQQLFMLVDSRGCNVGPVPHQHLQRYIENVLLHDGKDAEIPVTVPLDIYDWAWAVGRARGNFAHMPPMLPCLQGFWGAFSNAGGNYVEFATYVVHCISRVSQTLNQDVFRSLETCVFRTVLMERLRQFRWSSSNPCRCPGPHETRVCSYCRQRIGARPEVLRECSMRCCRGSPYFHIECLPQKDWDKLVKLYCRQPEQKAFVRETRLPWEGKESAEESKGKMYCPVCMGKMLELAAGFADADLKSKS